MSLIEQRGLNVNMWWIAEDGRSDMLRKVSPSLVKYLCQTLTEKLRLYSTLHSDNALFNPLLVYLIFQRANNVQIFCYLIIFLNITPFWFKGKYWNIIKINKKNWTLNITFDVLYCNARLTLLVCPLCPFIHKFN